MRGRIVNLFNLVFGVLVGGVLVYFIITNPIKKNEEAGALGCQYTSCENKVIIENDGISASVEKVYDAVVMVKNYKNNTLQGTGSGFVYKKDKEYGYIMTNHHVVEKSTSLAVKMTKNDNVKAELLGSDSYLDVAVIRIPVKYVSKVVEIGKTNDLKLGDNVFTIGSPVGEGYFNSITSGIVSGLNRKITVSIYSKNDWVMDVLQVDAAINPGNSGGPLLNYNGEVIGMNSLKLVDSQIEGMGFAIKIEDAMAHVKEFENNQEIVRPYLGIEYSVNSYGNTSNGVEIINVISGCSAEKAGLKKGDILLEIGGNKITDVSYLKYLLYKYNVGDKIKIKYSRNGKENTTTLTLLKEPK